VTGDLDPLVSLADHGEALDDEPGARNLADVVRGLVALVALPGAAAPGAAAAHLGGQRDDRGQPGAR